MWTHALRCRRCAFTLIELLVAMVLIAVLVALMVPSLSYARRRAQLAVCMSNLRQMRGSYANYAVQNGGQTIAYQTTAQNYWIGTLAQYNSKMDNVFDSKNNLTTDVNQNLICPAATTFARDVGSATAAWGPNASSGVGYTSSIPSPGTTASYWQFLDNYAGGYGMNTNMYANPLYGTVMANSFVGSGGFNVNGNVVVAGGVNLSGINITGSLTASGSITSSGTVTGTTSPNTPGIAIPNVTTVYNQLASGGKTVGSVSGASTLDFSQNPVLVCTGSPTIVGTPTTVGTGGTLCVSGNVTLVNSNPGFNIVSLGSVNATNVNGAGAIYSVGGVQFSGTSTMNGALVTNGPLTRSGTLTVHAPANLPWGGPSGGPVKGFFSETSRVLFADAIWPEGAPQTLDPPLSSSSKVKPNIFTGDIKTGLGRFYIARHGVSINVGFFDGHVENVPLSKVSGLAW